MIGLTVVKNISTAEFPQFCDCYKAPAGKWSIVTSVSLWVCVSVRLSVCEHRDHRSKLSVHVACGHGLVLPWQCYVPVLAILWTTSYISIMGSVVQAMQVGCTIKVTHWGTGWI